MRSKNTDISKMMDITNMTGNSSRMMNPFEGGEGGPTGDVLHDHE